MAGAAGGEPGTCTSQAAVVLPIVLLVIFVLPDFTYHSALEAADVLLTVPFALTGGVYLLWLLGYNFSVAVWVGFIALFGTAVQTGVVMVIYLEEAVARKQHELGGALTRAGLRDAVMEGALLRLRPKVMTVSTVIAGLLPIMWSTRAGAEVMKPLATPVLGGMVSSLLHVLIVTPVIFFWIRERRLGLQREPLPQDQHGRRNPRRMAMAAGVVALVALISFVVWRTRPGGSEPTNQSAERSYKRSARATSISCCGRRPALCDKDATASRSSSGAPARPRWSTSAACARAPT